jgi:hypothetical protein
VSHNVWEGRKSVEAARKYNRIVQTGTQSRSMPAVREALEWVKAGNIGKIKIARGLCYKRRPDVEMAPPEVKSLREVAPPEVNYDLWCGPSPLDQKPRKSFHYDWHWYWPTGNGDIGNQGIHEMDKARWATGKNTLAYKVMSIGGRMGYHDNADSAATQMAVFDYGDMLLIFEVRGLPSKPGNPNMDKFRGASVGNVIECEGGYVSGGATGSAWTAYDWKDKPIKKFSDKADESTVHFANFIKAVQSRKAEDLHADILEGHLSSALCHMANVSLRLGEKAKPGEIRDRIKGDKAALETFNRMAEHLKINDVDIEKDEAKLGPMLAMDVKTEKFTGDHADDANKLVKDNYRSPYVVPDEV